MFGEQLQGGELRGPGDHHHRHPHGLGEPPARLGRDHAEEQPEGDDDDEERQRVAEAAPEPPRADGRAGDPPSTFASACRRPAAPDRSCPRVDLHCGPEAGVIAGVILAGGRATRMGGGDKGCCRSPAARSSPRSSTRLAPQVDALALNANGDPARFAAFGLPVLADPLPGRPGPLAGVLAGLEWAAGLGADTLVTTPADTPFLPPDLVAALRAAAARDGRPAAAVVTPGRDGPERHPLRPRGRCRPATPLRAALAAGTRRVRDFAAALGCADAAMDADAFRNLNTPADLAAAEALLARAPLTGSARRVSALHRRARSAKAGPGRLRPARRSRSPVPTNLASRAAIHTASFYVALFMATGVHLPFWPLWLEDWGLDAAAVGTYTALGVAIRVVAGLAIPAIADRTDARRLTAVVCALASALALSRPPRHFDPAGAPRRDPRRRHDDGGPRPARRGPRQRRRPQLRLPLRRRSAASARPASSPPTCSSAPSSPAPARRSCPGGSPAACSSSPSSASATPAAAASAARSPRACARSAG